MKAGLELRVFQYEETKQFDFEIDVSIPGEGGATLYSENTFPTLTEAGKRGRDALETVKNNLKEYYKDSIEFLDSKEMIN